MKTHKFVHACPKDKGTSGCPVQGMEVVVLPQHFGSYYTVPTPLCFYTDVELKRVVE